MLKKIVIIFALLALCLQSISVSAHEFSPSRRWYNVLYNSNDHYYYADVPVCRVNLNSEYLTAYGNACADWSNYSNAHVLIEKDSSLPRVTVRSDYWDSTWPSNGTGCTSPTLDTSSTPNKITWATIYLNTSTTSGWTTYDKEKTIGHELGHCLGLNETNDGTISIMKQGQGSTLGWSNYWRPQSHDTSDVTSFYQ